MSTPTQLPSLRFSNSFLDHSQVERMVERVTRGRKLPDDVVQQIAEKTDGVPLFVEELTKTIQESGIVQAVNGHYELTGPLASLAIPASLHDSLMARLDRLQTAKEVAQLAASIGREFSYELLQAVSLVEESHLQESLRQLVAAELVYQRGVIPQAHYLFKHALIQDTAYDSLLKSQRRTYHQQIGQVLEAQFPETAETQPEMLAYHYTEGRLAEQAIPYWQQAGQNAVRHSANAEAIHHLIKGLELVQALPRTPEQTHQELALQMTLGPVLMMTKGYAAPEVERAYARARELCQQLGETPELFSALFGLMRFYAGRAQYPAALELGQQLVQLAQRLEDSVLLLEAHCMYGFTLLSTGDFVAAREHLEQGLALYNPEQQHLHIVRYGRDPQVVSQGVLALVLWHLGYSTQARQKSNAAERLADQLSHPYSSAMMLNSKNWLQHCLQQSQALEEGSQALVALSREQGFLLWLSFGTIRHGWALSRRGEGADGSAQIRQVLSMYRRMGTESFLPYFLALLAETCRTVGAVEEGLTLVTEALDIATRTGERFYEAELYRLKGELTLQSHAQNLELSVREAEASFHKAIEVAHQLHAKSWELRAATSLARLWQSQGKKHEPRELLAPVYHWFTEGFDTADLKDAKALLEQLA